MIRSQSYEKMRAEQNKLVYFLCRVEEVPLSKAKNLSIVTNKSELFSKKRSKNTLYSKKLYWQKIFENFRKLIKNYSKLRKK